jgi:hypothetical protein
MTITVKHTKVSAIPDAGDANLVQPSDWNADHTLIGLGTMAEQDANNVAITGGAISGVTIPASNVTGTLQVNQGGTGATTLTGYVKGTGTTAMTASATIPNTDITGLGTASTRDAGTANGVATLDAGGKVPVSELPAAVLGALNYQGTWNASTNTPTLTSSVGTKGYYYVVSVAGNTNLDGITDWLVGDWAVYNGTVWQKVDNTETVTSVNGQTGAVVLTTTDVAEGTNQYFTQSRARQSLSAGTGISYDNTTGVITNSSPSLGGDVVGPASATDNAITRFDTTTGKLIQNSTVTLDDNGNVINANSIGLDTTPATLPSTVGTMFWDTGNKAPSVLLENGVELQLGQENVVLVYNNTGSTITNGQVVAVNGAQGQRPAVVLADADSEPLSAATLGIATENIAAGAEGFVTTFGLIRGIDTSSFTAGNPIYLSSTAGQFTATRPSAPAHTVFLGWIIKVNASSGEVFVNISNGWELDELHNVLISSPTGGNLLAYDQTNQYWKNINLTDGTAISITETTGGAITIANTGVTQATAGTGISVSAGTGNVTITNTAPDQTVSLTGAGTTTITGTYPNFTITSNDQYTGTVTAVTGSAPLASSGGTAPNLTISQAGASTDGYLSSTDWNTFNNKQPAGTYVTSVGATSPITSTGGTTPTIAMPAANGSTNGYLTSTDWTTFNSKAAPFTYTTNYIPYGQGTTTPNQNANFTFDGTTQTAPIQRASNGIVTNNKTIGTSFTIPSTDNAMSSGPVTLSAGVTVTVSSGSRWVVL